MTSPPPHGHGSAIVAFYGEVSTGTGGDVAARVTLQTIADRVGVSRMTVSNAFSKPDQLSAALRSRILAAADELGYVGPDPTARALARGTTGTIGIVLTSSLRFAFTDQVATRFLGAIAEELAPTGLAITLLTSADSGAIVPARDLAMDGALIYSCDPTSSVVEVLSRRRMPLVYVDQDPVAEVSSVNVDDRAGARAAAQHLVDLGHRRIGLLLSGLHGPHGVVDPDTLPPDGHASRQRLLGWQDALRPAGIIPPAVRQDGTGPEPARHAAHLLLDRPDRPTAVLCFSDVVAHGVLQAAAELGIEVPRELSVAGFDDNPIAVQVRPALTTVRQDVEAKGRAAAAALTAAIAQSRTTGDITPQHVLLPTGLVVRDSTAPPS
ncbi:alanine racemase [Actinoplanes philippinensis]|uniref:DNA-binding transcriptional regulator, LacI/PurR family n=1 Tax=Actinoplanes philippinensis TaxID=35752 RepID=A0A1I2N1G6_9ACTN|nr:LacI family DNA-binding transcriptional regulator [Actinoplanes philippinensis]GIE83363.1 alanine racemase [Actinoplanes philippinensis]SFF97238.1 DNA-binding transcriptional regulator, LacI/PurR family [Actinoplanes philippinensis]